MKRHWLALLIFVVALGTLVLHAWRYLPFIADDALISLRYSQRLLEGHGLSWTDGERVEGYSNLLWVLAAAGLGGLGIELILALRILGLLGMGAAVAAVVWAYRPPGAAPLGQIAWSSPRRRGPRVLTAVVRTGSPLSRERQGRDSEPRRLSADPIAAPPPDGADASTERGLTCASLVGAIAPPLGAALALALAGPIAVWAIGGLEQAFVAAFLAWALVLAYPLVEEGRDRALPAAIPLALLVLTRPDGPIFTAAIALAIVLCRRRRGLRTAARLIALPFAAFLGQLAFRLIYYGDWVANTARAKVAFSPEHLRRGLDYLESGGLWLGALVLLALGILFALRDGGRRRRALLLGLSLVMWLGYVAAVGGDIFPARRHLVPGVVICSLLSAEFLQWATAHRARWIRLGGASFGLVALLAFGVSQWRDPDNHRAIHERWEWDGQVVGQLLRDAFAEQKPLLAVDPAGCLPFFSELPSLDMLGLNDGWLARNPPPDFGKGFIGHELGNGAYVLSRDPDLILFCLPGGGPRPCFRSGRELVREPRFEREWSLLHFEGRVPYRFASRIWVRKEGGGVLGIQHDAGRVLVPGYLLSTSAETPATLDPNGSIGASIPPGKRGRVTVAVEGGELRIDADASAPLHLSVEQHRRRIAAGRAPLRVEASQGELVITATPAGGSAGDRPVHVYGLEVGPLVAETSITAPARSDGAPE